MRWPCTPLRSSTRISSTLRDRWRAKPAPGPAPPGPSLCTWVEGSVFSSGLLHFFNINSNSCSSFVCTLLSIVKFDTFFVLQVLFLCLLYFHSAGGFPTTIIYFYLIRFVCFPFGSRQKSQVRIVQSMPPSQVRDGWQKGVGTWPIHICALSCLNGNIDTGRYYSSFFHTAFPFFFTCSSWITPRLRITTRVQRAALVDVLRIWPMPPKHCNIRSSRRSIIVALHLLLWYI